MGAAGSGPRTQFVFDEKTISNIRKWRTLGLSWTNIALGLGMKSETPLEKFRKENPEIDLECGEKKLNIQAKFIQQWIRYVSKQMEEGAQVNPQHIQKLMEYFGIFQKENNSSLTAIQVNNSDNKGLQVRFVKPNELTEQEKQALPEKDVIDV